MEAITVQELIKGGLTDAEVFVEGEGCNFSVTVVSSEFDGLPRVKSQQKVLATVQEPLATGELHAITVKTFTPDQWAQR